MVIEPPSVRSGPRRAGRDGSVEVFIADEQGDVEVDTSRYSALVTGVLADEGVHGDIEFALMFIDVDTMTTLNSTHMGGSGPTDVLAFPIDDEMFQTGRSPDGATRRPQTRDLPTEPGPILLGDVVVCPSVAAGQAVEHAGSYPGHDGSVEAEIDLLVVHGILHVLGHDHAEADEREVMQSRERSHLSKFRSRPWR